MLPTLKEATVRVNMAATVATADWYAVAQMFVAVCFQAACAM